MGSRPPRRSRYQFVVSALSMCFLSLVASGCGSMITGVSNTQSVFIDSEPHGAAVVVDGQSQGATPSRMLLERGKSHDVLIELSGYHTESRTIRSGPNGWFLGNLAMFGMFPVGMGIDLMTGSWRSLSDTDFTVRLSPQTGLATATPTPPR